ncbi:E3 ubiquitin-protein ligase TRIM71-like [Actinia tenebrosa]|uniref:E3 ubiquitin-protein ligase TRIM71-like n=1 Tax=Actinia tenebrosa TaxID=6105 RepID=A0A6P8HZU2_ACTTE|nr:E3 ubiquitin-protein ligase TRIM71-like [Actinia tenebrosa]
MATLKAYVDDLEKELTCSICLGIFENPKALPCLHSYCSKCIKDWYEKCKFRAVEFTCPMCKTEEIDLPDGDASKLRSSFYFDALLRLLHAMKSNSDQEQKSLPECASCEKSQVLAAFCPECNGLICEDCIDSHRKIKQLRTDHNIMMLKEFKQENVDNYIKNQMLCKAKFHEKKRLEYYCKEKNCRQCICQKCATLYHQNHCMCSLEEASEEIKTAMEQDKNRLHQLTDKYKEELEQSKQNMQRIQNEIESAKRDVHNTVDALIQTLKQHEIKTIETLDKVLLEKTLEIKEEQTDLTNGIDHLDEYKQYCQLVQERNVACEILENEEAIKQRGQALLDTLTALLSKSIHRNETYKYTANQDVLESLQNVGNFKKHVTDPLRCTIEGLKDVRCGFEHEFYIVTRNAEGELCYAREESFDIMITDVEGNEVEKKVVSRQAGKFCLSYKAKRPGLHEIQVNIGGDPIKNSPQKVNSLDAKKEFELVKMFGEKGAGKGQLDKPTTISLSDKGEIAIAECNNHRVQIFNLEGKHLRDFSLGESALFKPFGAVFNEDKIIVIDQPDNHGRIQVFDLNGTFVKTIYRPVGWFRPGAMCTTDENNIAVTCWGNDELGIKSSVKIFTNQGEKVFEFPASLGKDEKPSYIAYRDGKYFISYFEKDFIAVFDKNGKFLCKFGKKGKKDGQFNGIGGLGIFGPDMILVCDVKHHRVQLLTQDGIFIRSFGGLDVGTRSPADVVVTAHGQVFVLECIGNRVQVWS